MKRAIIGAAFFVGGAVLVHAEAVSGGGVLGLFGIMTGLSGMIILIYELLTKDEKS